MVRHTLALFVFAGALSMSRGAHAACAPIGFTGGATVFAGPKAQTMTLANVNGDEWIDAVVAGYDQNYQPIGGLYILLGQPGARWRPHTSLVTEQNINDVVAGDFDGDRDDDLAYQEVFGSGTGIVHLLRNDRGTFSELASYSYDPWSWGLTAGDFNGDGRDDIAFISRDGRGHLFLGRAIGIPEERAFGGPAEASRPAVADLDRDGFDDLVVGRYDDYDKGAVLIFAGDRDQGLRAPRAIEVAAGIIMVAIGDFDGTGDRDVLGLGRLLDRVVFLPGAAMPRLVSFPVGGWNAPLVADFDRDGIDDLAFSGDAGLQIVAGTTTGQFVARDAYFVTARGPYVFGPADTAASDFDHDGDIDVAAVTLDGLTVLRNDGAGTLTVPRFGALGHAVGDFNNDGRDDVVDTAGIRLSGTGGVIQPGPIGERFERDRIRFVKTADVNRDANLDAIYFLDEASNRDAGRVRVFLGNGDGTLRLAQEFEMGEDYRDVVVADFDNDGVVDVMSANFTSDDDHARSMALGRGDGTFASPVDLHGPPFLDGLEAADFNGDGRVDLATMGGNTDKPLAIWLGLGPGTFATPVGVGPFFNHFVVADVNDDGLTDIVGAVSWDSASLYVLLARGDGTFIEKPPADGVVTDLRQIDAGDFDADGDLDVLLTEGGTTASRGWMALLVGDGTGNFGPPIPIRATALGIAHTGDFDGDGKLDILDGGFPRLNTCEESRPRRRAARH